MGQLEDVVASYTALEKIWLGSATDEQKVQWFQQRAVSAEAANAALLAESESKEIVAKFPTVDPTLLSGFKTRAEKEAVAARITESLEKAGKVGQETVEAAVKEALKVSEAEIVEMRKVYGRARQPQAGDVTGVGIAQTAAAAAAGIGTGADEKIELGTMAAVTKTAEKITGPLFGVLGLGGKQ